MRIFTAAEVAAAARLSTLYRQMVGIANEVFVTPEWRS